MPPGSVLSVSGVMHVPASNVENTTDRGISYRFSMTRFSRLVFIGLLPSATSVALGMVGRFETYRMTEERGHMADRGRDAVRGLGNEVHVTDALGEGGQPRDPHAQPTHAPGTDRERTLGEGQQNTDQVQQLDEEGPGDH